MNLSRRTFGLGLIATLAAPAIIRPGLIMPIKPQIIRVTDEERYQQLMQQWHETSIVGRDLTREGFMEPARQNSIIEIRAEMAQIERRIMKAAPRGVYADGTLPLLHPVPRYSLVPDELGAGASRWDDPFYVLPAHGQFPKYGQDA